ncbi:MAG: M16 family metallopeptidase [bacterium]|jgi:zinc protease
MNNSLKDIDLKLKFYSLDDLVFVIPDNSIPITYLSVYFLSGSYLEKINKLGLNYLVFKTLTRSTKKFKYEDLNYYLEKYSISISSFGGYFNSGISLSFPFYNYKEAIYVLNNILYDYIFRSFDLEEVKRDAINSIKVLKDDVYSYLTAYADKSFYNSFLANDVKGNIKNIKKFNRKDLINWYEKLINSKNIKKLIIISGYTTPNFEQLVFKNLKKILNKNHNFINEMYNFDIIPKKITHKLNKVETGICIIYPAPTYNLDFFDYKVISSILGSMSGRLFVNIREKQELAYVITSYYEPLPIKSGNIKFTMLTSKENKNKAINALFNEVNNIINNGFHENEIDIAKNYIVGNYIDSFIKRSFKASLLAKSLLFDIPLEFTNNYLDYINSVNKDSVNSKLHYFKNKPGIFIVD